MQDNFLVFATAMALIKCKYNLHKDGPDILFRDAFGILFA
jgi:hypothetical protein